MGILDSLLRGGLENWVVSPTGFEVPRAIRTVDETYMHPEKLFSWYDFEKGQKELNNIRHKTLEKIGPSLNPCVQKVFTQV
jgi:hypothetical protein